MKIETINLDKERQLITLLTMNDSFCASIMPVFIPDVLTSLYARNVGAWCKEYYEQYRMAPKASIQDIFRQRAVSMTNADLADSIKVFLDRLTADYKASLYNNLPYYVDEATDYLRVLGLLEHCNKVTALTNSGKLDQAEAEIATFKQSKAVRVSGISLVRDTDTIVTMLSAVDTPLFKLDGDLGKVAGSFYRKDFMAGLSSMKGSKSWFLQYVDQCAALSGLKVCHIDLEMRVEEPLQRFVRGMLSAPIKDMDVNIPKFVSYDAEPNEHSLYHVEHQIVHKTGVPMDVDKLRQELYYRLHSGGDIMIFSMPSGATTVRDIEALLDNLERYQGYVPDVLTIDYCDLLGSAERDYRQKLNDIWLNLRRVVQERNIFGATVTQSTRAGVSGKELNSEDISEDIRKLAHVTTFLSIYGTDDQKKNDTCFVKCLETRARRETWDSAMVLQCLDIGRWYLDSRLKNQVTA